MCRIGIFSFFICSVALGMEISLDKPSFSSEFVVVESPLENQKASNLSDPEVFIEKSILKKPLVKKNLDGENVDFVKELSDITLGGALRVNKEIQVGGKVTYRSVSFEDSSDNFQGVSDSTFYGQWSFRDDLDMYGEITIPFVSQEFVTSDTLGTKVGAIKKIKLAQKIEATVNTGANYNSGNFSNIIDNSKTVYLNWGTKYDVSHKFDLILEGTNHFSIENSDYSGRIYLGGNYKLSDTYNIYSAASMANNRIDESMNLGIVTGLSYTPFEKEVVKEKPKVIVKQCGYENLNIKTPARKLTTAEVRILGELPLKGTELLNYEKAATKGDSGVPLNIDSMQVMAFDLSDLPPKNAIRGIRSATVYGSKTQFSESTHEIFCIHNKKVCSGEYKKGKGNNSYFKGKETPNDYFLGLGLGDQVDSYGGKAIFQKEVAIQLKKLLENVPRVSTLNYLYGNVSPFERLKKNTVYFVVGPNTRMDNATLSLTLTEDTCYGGR